MVELLTGDRKIAGNGMTGEALPVLWHLKVSHYNEKARWALDYKGIPHVRRAPMPGRHAAIAQRLSGGTTLPVLELDPEPVGDSTRIIGLLERRYPDPPLYPADPAARRRALEIEDYFDEELGPHIRLLVLHHVLPDPALMLGTFAPDLVGARRLAARATFAPLRRRIVSQFGISLESVDLAYEKLHAACQRFQRELEPSGYLVGDRFTVADLTLASMVAPAVAPEQFPYPQPQRRHPLLAPVRDPLAKSGLAAWAEEMYARHRGTSAEVTHAPA
jgi:glutathione S-transferase